MSPLIGTMVLFCNRMNIYGRRVWRLQLSGDPANDGLHLYRDLCWEGALRTIHRHPRNLQLPAVHASGQAANLVDSITALGYGQPSASMT